jgi:hypothetical protein
MRFLDTFDIKIKDVMTKENLVTARRRCGKRTRKYQGKSQK